MKRIPTDEFQQRIESNAMAEMDCLPQGLELLEDCTFAVTEQRGLHLDAYVCEAASGPRPAILFLHGGGWRGGSKEQFSRQAAYLASKHNFLAVCSEYRFSTEARFPACLLDARSAVEWICARADEYSVDTERLAISGGSAGGHLAALAATTASAPEYGSQPVKVALCIPHNAPLNLVSLGQLGQALGPIQERRGGGPDEMPEVYREASPFHRAGPDTPPMLLMHGGGDTLIPCEESVAIHEKLLSLGVHSELEIWPGKGHGWFNHAPDFAAVLQRMEQFLVEGFALG